MNIEIDKDDKERESYSSGVGRGHWLTDQTRPDCSYDEPELLTMTHKATVNNIPKLNERFLKQDSVTIEYKKLRRIDELKLTVFSDASYDNLPDGESSGMGFLIFLSVGFNPGKVSPCYPLLWTAFKVQRKVSINFAAETLFLLAALGQVIKVEAVAWIPTKFQLGDCLTKGVSTRGLLQTINPANTNF